MVAEDTVATSVSVFRFAISVSPTRLTTQSAVQIPTILESSAVLAVRGPEWQHYKNGAGCPPLLATCDFWRVSQH